MEEKLFKHFLEIGSCLNQREIVPVLMGSLGLEYVSGKDWCPSDIDIHVPGDPRGWRAPDEDRIYHWDKIQALMEDEGYILVDLHEHEFEKNGVYVEFGSKDTLLEFSGVNPEDLRQKNVGGVRFLVPSEEQFLSIYQASSEDSYRNENNNFKDFKKIDYLKEVLDD